MRRCRMFIYINIYKHSLDMLYMLIILCVDVECLYILVYKNIL